MAKKQIFYLFFTLLLTITVSAICCAQVRVKGYYRKDGTYVRPHMRSNPDGNPYNNWSYPGNINPYTGKVATGNPETYLRNYQKNGKRIYNAASSQNLVSNIQAWVSASVLNVRQFPSIKSFIIGKLHYLDIVEVQKIQGNWAFVTYYCVNLRYQIKTQKGYVATKYLIDR